jgi:hypothetical protein
VYFVIDIVYEDVWQKVSNSIRDDVVEFWKANGLTLPPQELNTRVDQLVFIARDSKGSVIGVCTAYKMEVDQLKNFMYGFRCLVGSENRQKHLAIEFISMTFEKFDDLSNEGTLDDCIGILVSAESQLLRMKTTAFAVWKRTHFVYIGMDASGAPMRVRYFKDACI